MENDPEEMALLEGVMSRLREDHPRLVYADWLDDHGQEDRGDFIRVQCELAATEIGTAERGELRGREGRLLRDDTVVWFPIPQLRRHQEARWATDRLATFEVRSGLGDDRLAATCEVRRGFLDTLRCSWADWLLVEAALCWHPDHSTDAAKDRGGESWDNSRVSRPMPPTAQPVRKVVLTTEPAIRTTPTGWQLASRSGIHRFRADNQPHEPIEKVVARSLKAEWPWLEFELVNITTLTEANLGDLEVRAVPNNPRGPRLQRRRL